MKLIEPEINVCIATLLVQIEHEKCKVLQRLRQRPLNQQEILYHEKYDEPRFVCFISHYQDQAGCNDTKSHMQTGIDCRRLCNITPGDSAGAENLPRMDAKVAGYGSRGESSCDETKPLKDGIFQISAFERGIGCEHFIQRFALRCKKCGKRHTCPYCHNQHESHDFEFGAQICFACGYEQSQFERTCVYCGFQYGEALCSVCCIVHKENEIFHCMKCNSCCSAANAQFHASDAKCPEDVCPICLETLKQNKTVFGGQCGHFCHETCLNLLDSISCPICQRTALTPAQREEHLAAVLRERNRFAPALFCVFKCQDCQREGCTVDADDIYCQHCGFVNCVRLRRATREQYTQYKESFPVFVELRRPATFEDACSNITDIDMQVQLLVRSYAVRTRADVCRLFDEINEVLEN